MILKPYRVRKRQKSREKIRGQTNKLQKNSLLFSLSPKQFDVSHTSSNEWY